MIQRFLGLSTAPEPTHVAHRADGGKAAVVLLHGFSGQATATWDKFIEYLLVDGSVQSWDIHSVGYPSALRVDVPRVWSADPGLDVLALSLRTALSLEPLRSYRALAIVAHSMGGLIVQRSILDDEDLRRRVSHVALFGTPSGGLGKAGFVSLLKRQFRDMDSNGAFVRTLRNDWASRIGDTPPFAFKAIAGDTDEFVSAGSSLSPFADQFRAVVPGNHLSIIGPAGTDHRGLRLLVDVLNGAGRVPGVVDGARLAVELGHFREAAETLLPRAAELDEAALASLALALEGLGRRDEALLVLEENVRNLSSTDAFGILGGRLKRRWLVERASSDLDRARGLYLRGLKEAERSGDCDQAMYHAINIAFLDLTASPTEQPVPVAAREMAERARGFCRGATEGYWRLATEAEACLVLGDLPAAEDLYRRALTRIPGPRAVQSTYAQAVRVAARVFGEPGAASMEQLFGLTPRGEGVSSSAPGGKA